MIGTGALDILREKRDRTFKITKADEKEIAAHYRKELKNMEKTGIREFTSFQ